jgi:hypothetical protein
MEIDRRPGIAARVRQLGLPRDRNTDVVGGKYGRVHFVDLRDNL